MKILLAVDGSKYTKKMLAYLTTHAEIFTPKNDYTLFTAQPLVPPRAVVAVGKEVVRQFHEEDAEKVLAPAYKFLARHDINAHSSWKVGHAAETIAKFAESGKFDLILMGSHGHGSVVNMVMGSVATKVLASCNIPVLLIR
ncbi:MAG: universal stress protein [Burkholderiaceae bacterium]